MSQFLDYTGLQTFLSKIKEWVNSVVNSSKSTIDSYTVNGKAISSNPSLTAAEVGAIPSSQKGNANGVASLGSDGKVPSSQLPELDLSLYKVVSALPTTISEIDVNKIYLLPSDETGEKNVYTEYVYIGSTSSAYDESKWEILGEYTSNVDLTPYIKFTDIATTSKAGAMSAADKTRLDGIFAGNMALPTPVISGSWEFYKNDGSTKVEASAITPVPDTNNPTLEEGYKAKFTGTYKWTHEEGKKDPTQAAGNSSWQDLPSSGQNSNSYNTGVVGANTTVRAAAAM